MYRFFLLLFFICSVARAQPVIDDTGQKIQLHHPAHRIISLAPDLTELLFAAGAGNYIVGEVGGCDYPPQAHRIPIVANYNNANLEAVIALHPDLIVAWTEGDLPEKFKKLGVPIYFSHQTKISDIPITLKRLGCLAGTEKIADQAAENFTQRFTQLKKEYAHQKTVSVFYEVWPQPLMTIAKDSWINEVISICGGKNSFENLTGAAPEISLEAVITANPDVIISGTDKGWQKMWLAWPKLNAVKNHHLFTINPDWVERAGPRVLDGATLMCRDLELVRMQQEGNLQK